MIDILQYSSLVNWSLGMTPRKQPLVKTCCAAIMLSELLERAMEPVKIQDDVKYTRLTIKMGGGWCHCEKERRCTRRNSWKRNWA